MERTSEGIFGLADAELAGLLEGRDGLADARNGSLVGIDVEAADRLVDELRRETLSVVAFRLLQRLGDSPSRGPLREACWRYLSSGAEI